MSSFEFSFMEIDDWRISKIEQEIEIEHEKEKEKEKEI
jgi:hypothetical protein